MASGRIWCYMARTPCVHKLVEQRRMQRKPFRVDFVGESSGVAGIRILVCLSAGQRMTMLGSSVAIQGSGGREVGEET